MTPRKLVLAVALVTIVVQVVSATQRTRLESPNASTRIAMNLDQRGIYGVEVGDGAWWRAFQLPGEPLYLFGGFRALPPILRPYLHVPVVLLWVSGIALVATNLAGARAGLISGLFASLAPFTVVHGPVWDDAWLAAGLDWTVFAIAISCVTRLARGAGQTAIRLRDVAAVAMCAGYASVTRSQSLFVLAPIALAFLFAQRFRPLRKLGWTMSAGMIFAVGAWTLRNWLVLGAVVIGSTHDGQTLWHSNNPTTRRAVIETGVAQSYADMSLGAQRGEVEADRVYRHAGIDYLRSSTLDATKTAAVKIAVSLTGLDLSQPLTALRNAGVACWAVALIVVGGWGLRTLRDAPIAALAIFKNTSIVCVVVTAVMLALGPVGLRYWLTLSGVLYIGAGSAFRRLWVRHK